MENNSLFTSADTKTTVKFREARQQAHQAISKFYWHCDKIAIVGQVLRQCRIVDCIEIVCAPKLKTGREDLPFTEQVIDEFWSALLPFNMKEDLEYEYRFELAGGLPMKIYLCSADSFGFWHAVYTGSKTFLEAHVKHAINKHGYAVKQRRLFKNGQSVAVPTEAEFFALLDIAPVDYKYR